MSRTPEEVVEQLRALRNDLADEIRAMSADQRRDLRNRTKSSPELISASISAIGTSDTIAAAVGRNQQKVQNLMMADIRWALLEQELRGFLNEVSSAGLARRHQLDLIATQTFAVTKQLVRSPENRDLISIFEEMQAIRKHDRRKKRAPKADAEPEP
ncbi:MAG TPA: hypothetical protein VH087_09380 [Thermoanaerobaculia bacterium]|jgi:hypothetical protein|nr:hypothetical protein [Thermoanaerobaculia bacterium]